jgi:hypothetical protein
VSRWTSQREHVEGAPYGTRGGVSVVHTFPADGDYRFRVSFYHETTGALYGNGRAALHTATAPEQVEISIDGARAALLDIDRWMSTSDPDGVNLRTRADRDHRRAASRLGRVHPPLRRAGAGSDLAARLVAGEHQHRRRLRLHDAAAPARHGDHRSVRPTGVSTTPSRAQDLHVPPGAPAAQRARPRWRQMVCAREIVSRLATQAFRRPVAERDRQRVDVALHEGRGRRASKRASGWRSRAILASPRFVFRFEERRRRARAGRRTRCSDVDLASRLSFFLWASGPDEELLRVAERPAVVAGGARAQSRRHARRSPRRRPRVALRRAVAAAAGSRQDQSRTSASIRTSTSS